MSEAFSNPSNRIKTFTLLVVCGLFSVAAAVAGIDYISPGLVLAFLAATALVLAFVHTWRTARQFGSLLFASALGMPVFVILSNLSAEVAPAATGPLLMLTRCLAPAAFFLAILISPAAFIVSGTGLVVLFIRSRRRKT